MKKSTTAAAWIGIVFAVSGAILLYPIGKNYLNLIFIVVKICMVAGLLIFLFGMSKRRGLTLWTWASAIAVVMTICKWVIIGNPSGNQIGLFILSMAADILLPAILWKLCQGAFDTQSDEERKLEE